MICSHVNFVFSSALLVVLEVVFVLHRFALSPRPLMSFDPRGVVVSGSVVVLLRSQAHVQFPSSMVLVRTSARP